MALGLSAALLVGCSEDDGGLATTTNQAVERSSTDLDPLSEADHLRLERDARGLVHTPHVAHTEPALGHPRQERQSGLRKARGATAGYHRSARATDDGYALAPEGPLHECIAGHHGPGAMGFHWINGTLAGDTVLDPATPEALLYEPRRNGRLRLVGLEYVVFADAWESEHPGDTPRLFGRELTFVPEGNRYELPAFYQIHAWVWRHNPAGMFADFNPRVSCDSCTHA